MNEFQAALLCSQMDRLEEQGQLREANGSFLNEELSKIPGIRPMQRGFGESRHGYHLYIFRYDSSAFHGLPRHIFLTALNAEGIPCSSGYDRPLYKQPIFVERDFGPYLSETVNYPDYAQISLPVSEQACQEACWLAHYLLLGNQKDTVDIVEAVNKVYKYHQELL